MAAAQPTTFRPAQKLTASLTGASGTSGVRASGNAAPAGSWPESEIAFSEGEGAQDAQEVPIKKLDPAQVSVLPVRYFSLKFLFIVCLFTSTCF